MADRDVIGALRDLILMEADFLAEQAEWLEFWAMDGAARPVLNRRLKISAIAYKQRLKILHVALYNSDPADRQYGCIKIKCDSCSEIFEGEKGEKWQEVWPRAKDEGWRSKQIGSIWVHACPDCGV